MNCVHTEKDPEKSVRLVVCGDFNGGEECGAVRYLEDGYIDETFVEDGEPVSSGKKAMPLAKPLVDVSSTVERAPKLWRMQSIPSSSYFLVSELQYITSSQARTSVRFYPGLIVGGNNP